MEWHFLGVSFGSAEDEDAAFRYGMLERVAEIHHDQDAIRKIESLTLLYE